MLAVNDEVNEVILALATSDHRIKLLDPNIFAAAQQVPVRGIERDYPQRYG